MRIAIDNRAQIEQIKGMIMVTFNCDADTAWDLMVRLSQHLGVRL